MSHRPSRILKTVPVDLIGPLPTGWGGVQYILAMVDTFSKYAKLNAMKWAITTAILNRIEKDYVEKIRRPKHILTDNGTQITTKRWKNTMKKKGVGTKYATKYLPQTNPVERYNHKIRSILRTNCATQHTKLPKYLEKVEYWINQLRPKVTEVTLWQIIKGITPKWPIKQEVKLPRKPSVPERKKLVTLIESRIRRKADKASISAERKRKYIKYRVGQQILVRNRMVSRAKSKNCPTCTMGHI